MNTKKRLVLILASTIAVMSVAAYFIWSAIQQDMVLACTVSIHKSLISLKRSEPVPSVDTVGPDWKALRSDSDRLLLAASQSGSFDCREREHNGLPIDPWRNHFQVAVRRSKETAEIEFLVWSNGPDGVAGTSDDISSPRGETVPRR